MGDISLKTTCINTHNVVTKYFSLGWDIMVLNVLLMSEELVSVGLVSATKYVDVSNCFTVMYIQMLDITLGTEEILRTSL